MPPKLSRRRPLSIIGEVRCPAASPIDGITQERQAVICGVMRADRDREQGLGMTPGQVAQARDGNDGVLMTAKSDPNTIDRLCCGDAIPVLDDGGQHARDSYTYCPVWQAEKKRIEDGRRMLAGGGLEAAPETVEHFDDGRAGKRSAPAGSSHAAADPWAQARRDLDVLAPREG